jgi:hypothetical protein
LLSFENKHIHGINEIAAFFEQIDMSNKGYAIEIADRLHRAATELLAGGLEALLQTCGFVSCLGSYYLDLMAWPDLDLCIPLDTSIGFESKFLDLGPRFSLVCDLISLRYENTVRHPAKPLPNGLYWGVSVQQYATLRWKVDIWAVPAADIETNKAEVDRLKSKLTPQKRALILELKQALLTPEGRTPPFSGYHVYCAVLDHSLHTIDEIREYLNCQGISV